MQRRLVAQQASTQSPAGVKPTNAVPYVLFLVRPTGITTYHQALRALDGLGFDYGYELVDAEWVLDFPEGDAAPAVQPWMAAGARPLPVWSPALASTGKRAPAGIRGIHLAGGNGGTYPAADSGLNGAGMSMAEAAPGQRGRLGSDTGGATSLSGGPGPGGGFGPGGGSGPDSVFGPIGATGQDPGSLLPRAA